MMLNSLATLRDTGRIKEARKEYEEALKIYRELAQKEPNIYLPYVAATLNNLGILARAQNQSTGGSEGMREGTKSFTKPSRSRIQNSSFPLPSTWRRY